MWGAIQYVSGATTLAAFLAACGVIVYRRTLRHRERAIGLAPASERPKLVAATLDAFHIDIDTSRLSSDEMLTLGLEVLALRRSRLRFIALGVIFVTIAAATVLVVTVLNWTPKPPLEPIARLNGDTINEYLTSCGYADAADRTSYSDASLAEKKVRNWRDTQLENRTLSLDNLRNDLYSLVIDVNGLATRACNKDNDNECVGRKTISFQEMADNQKQHFDCIYDKIKHFLAN
jgi:hypothetical protein